MNRFALIAIFAVLIAFSSAFRMRSHNTNSTEPARTQVQYSQVCASILDNFQKDNNFMTHLVHHRYTNLIAYYATETDNACDYDGQYNGIWWNHKFAAHVSKDPAEESFLNIIMKDDPNDKYEVYHYTWTGNGEDTTALKVITGMGQTNPGTLYYTSDNENVNEEFNTPM